MRFADKLFLSTTALLTLIFTVFGTWMLSSYFQRVLNREIAQGETRSQMFQYLFEMAYQSVSDYGEDYAIRRTLDNVIGSVEEAETRCFVLDEAGEYYYGENTVRTTNREAVEEMISQLRENLSAGGSEGIGFVHGIRESEGGYHLFHICAVDVGKQRLYLGICRDLATIYEDRQELLNQYRMALALLLATGAVCIFLSSRYMTRPISNLERVAGKIADGSFELRSKYQARDEIGALAKSFNSMADRLVEQMQSKELEAKQQEDFTAAFAHELKTPLTSIIGYADMLNTIELSEGEKREAYYYIYSQGKRLESLSHKLLELVGMEKHPLERKAVSAKQLEENLRVTMRPIFEKRDIRGRITMGRGTLYGDFELLLSLFYNLLDNAVKATDAGGFVLLKGAALDKMYEVKVVDNGRGIPRDEIDRITEAFYMVDKSRSRKEGGAGIGMALCQKIIALHGGSLQIESKLGEGTVVRILFPIQRESGQGDLS